MNSKIKDINPTEHYSASHVAKNGWTVWKTVRSFTMFLNTEEGMRLYKPIIFTQGAVKRYRIRGESVISVLEAGDRGELKINHGQN